jgi:saccharopine dehydrogenase-like NADP-dependent oxidoreductase
MDALVLGGGMIGSAMAADLAADAGLDVTLADSDPAALARVAAGGVRTVRADLSDPAAVRRLAERADIVLGALPSRLGLSALAAVIEAGRNACDISFMEQDPGELCEAARARGVTVVTDCGVAPGLSNMLCGHAAARLSPCTRLTIMVGGLPVERSGPWEYKAGFAPLDVLAEYTRPARQVEGGRVVVHPALSGREPVDLPGVGRLEAFHTDGLRSLIRTLSVPDMTEKTLRYPGHAERMEVLRDAGLFGTEPLAVGDARVRPLDVASALLFPDWTFAEGEADLTVMRVTAEGLRDGRAVRCTWDLLDRYDPDTGLRSMSRTTAYPAVIMARWIASGRFVRPGVHPPEIPGAEPGLAEAMIEELARRGVSVREQVVALDASD